MTDGTRRSPWGVAALVLVMTGLAAWLIANSSLFATRDIRVLGNIRLTAREVQELAGVGVGDNLLRLGTDDAARSLEGSPWVAEASVRRSLPSTLVVRIVERRPVAWLRDRRGPVLLAADGVVLERSSRPPPGLPFAGRWSGAVHIGDQVGISPSLQVAASLPSDLAASVVSVRLEAGQVVLDLRRGVKARYGHPTALEAKNRALSSVLEWAQEHRMEAGTIDLRFPRTPALGALPSRG